MIIKGLQKTTLLDYPGHVAATIFLGGCNFRCPFCHNMNIVDISNESNNESYTEEEIFTFLKKRISVLDGVCITGGEPTINNELPEFIRSIKSISKENNMSLLVKLDTNGTNPDMLEMLIREELIDYVAMDIKSSEEKYGVVAGIIEDEKGNDIEKADKIVDSIKKSIHIIMDSGIDYEFRTTVVKPYHNEDDLRGIGELIKGAKRFFIQSFVDSEYVLNHTLKAYDTETLNKYANIISEYVKEVSIRGVD